MNKIVLLGLTAVVAGAEVASAGDHKGANAQGNDAAAPASAVQSAPRAANSSGPRYVNQGPRNVNYGAGLPGARFNPGGLAQPRNGTLNRDANWHSRQFDGRVLPDQTAIPRRTWKTLDQLRNRDQDLALQDMRGRRNRDRGDVAPADNVARTGAGAAQPDNTKVAVATNWRNRGNKVVPFDNSNTVSFSDAWRRCHEFGRDRHDRDWWHRRCNTIILISGGFWAWDAGWWYPAWGYDPSYSTYAYNGPVYGYDGLAPDQVIANVQGALQELGYFPYAVDGVLGENTQQAIADYQADNGLPVTGAIDRPTLVSLGFVY